MGRLIIEFDRLDAARAFLSDLENFVVLVHGEKGFSVWDEISESPEGTFYLSSPTGDPRFPHWRQTIPCEGTERIFPPEWITGE